MVLPPVPSSSLLVENWFNGLYTALMLTTVTIIVFNSKHSFRERSRLLAWVAVPYVCSTLHTSLDWIYFSRAVNSNEFPDGPGLSFSLTHLPVWLEGVGDTFFCLNILLADCLFIWRCWTIWGRRWTVVLFPMMTTACGAVLAGLIIADQVTALTTKEAFTIAKTSSEFVTLSTAYFCMSIATSLTTTTLIIIRILYVQSVSRSSENYHKFRPTIEIIVESAILYSFTLVIFTALDLTKSPNVFFAQNIHSQMAGIAPILITIRVVAGFARPQEEWSSFNSNSGDIRFAASNSGTLGDDSGKEITSVNHI